MKNLCHCALFVAPPRSDGTYSHVRQNTLYRCASVAPWQVAARPSLAWSRSASFCSFGRSQRRGGRQSLHCPPPPSPRASDERRALPAPQHASSATWVAKHRGTPHIGNLGARRWVGTARPSPSSRSSRACWASAVQIWPSAGGLKDCVGTESRVGDVIFLAVLNNPTTDLTHDLGVAKGLGNAIRPQLYDCPPSMSALALSLLFRVLG